MCSQISFDIENIVDRFMDNENGFIIISSDRGWIYICNFIADILRGGDVRDSVLGNREILSEISGIIESLGRRRHEEISSVDGHLVSRLKDIVAKFSSDEGIYYLCLAYIRFHRMGLEEYNIVIKLVSEILECKYDKMFTICIKRKNKVGVLFVPIVRNENIIFKCFLPVLLNLYSKFENAKIGFVATRFIGDLLRNLILFGKAPSYIFFNNSVSIARLLKHLLTKCIPRDIYAEGPKIVMEKVRLGEKVGQPRGYMKKSSVINGLKTGKAGSLHSPSFVTEYMENNMVTLRRETNGVFVLKDPLFGDIKEYMLQEMLALISLLKECSMHSLSGEA